MSSIIRARKSTKRLAFQFTKVTDGVTSPLDLTGATLELILDTEKVESTPDAPVHFATIAGVVSDAVNGAAYFPIDTTTTASTQTLYYEVWIVDGNGETYPIDSGKLTVSGSLK